MQNSVREVKTCREHYSGSILIRLRIKTVLYSIRSHPILFLFPGYESKCNWLGRISNRQEATQLGRSWGPEKLDSIYNRVISVISTIYTLVILLSSREVSGSRRWYSLWPWSPIMIRTPLQIREVCCSERVDWISLVILVKNEWK